MQARWLKQVYPTPTVQAVRSYMNEHGCGPVAAKLALQPRPITTLQVLTNGVWVDVPTEIVEVTQCVL